MVPGQPSATGVKNSALVLADNSLGKMGMLIRDLLRKFSWKAAESTYPDCTFQEIFGQMRMGLASCVIIDDYDLQPSPSVLRRLLADPVMLYTPTMLLINDANTIEMEALTSLGNLELLQKPISLGNFKAGFENMLVRWTKGPFAKLRRIGQDFATRNDKSALSNLVALNSDPAMQPYAAPGLALVFREREEYATAEKILLSALKLNPKHLGLMVALIELYLNFGMPDLALKVIASAERSFTGTLFLAVDKMQALMMLNRVDEMIPILDQMMRRSYATDTVQKFLPRCLLSEGFNTEFDKMIKGNLATKYRTMWGGKTQQAG